MPNPSVVSLYTGAGGLDLGLHAAGFDVRVVVECDPTAVATLGLPENRKWWRGVSTFFHEIKAVRNTDLLDAASARVGEVDLLAGGPPCQPFSKSGYWHNGDSKRLQDPRADTLNQYFRVLEGLLPRAFIIENVPGIAFSDKDEGLDYIRHRIEKINRRHGTAYSISCAQLNAVEYGVPQLRERVFVVGSRGGDIFAFPARTHSKPPPVAFGRPRYTAEVESEPKENESTLLPAVTAWDAIGHLSGIDDPDLRPKGKWAKLLPSIPEGLNYLHHTDRGDGEKLFGWRTRYWSMLLKLAKSRPSWTLTAQPGPAIGPFHWENRRLSAEELCALQTFPEGYRVSGSAQLAQRQLGNAVPSLLTEIIGKEMRRQFWGQRPHRKLKLMPRRQRSIPEPEPIHAVPEQYMGLVGEYQAHPGTGKGPGARTRVALEVPT